MPELPDIVTYIDALRPRVVGQPLQRVRLASPFVLRTVDPPIAAVEGRQVEEIRRLGKRIVWCLSDDLFLGSAKEQLQLIGRNRAARGPRTSRA